MSPQLPDSEFDEKLKDQKGAIYRFLLKKTRDPELSEDLSQDTLLRAHKSRHSYDTIKGEFSSWLIRIAHNLFLTWLQKKQKGLEESSFDKNQENFIASNSPDTSELVEQKILFHAIKKAIECLPEPERTVIYNKEIVNKKLAQTASELNISVRSVSRKLLSGYDQLRKELINQGIVPEGFVPE